MFEWNVGIYLHGITIRKTNIDIFTTVRTPCQTYFVSFLTIKLIVQEQIFF